MRTTSRSLAALGATALAVSILTACGLTTAATTNQPPATPTCDPTATSAGHQHTVAVLARVGESSASFSDDFARVVHTAEAFSAHLLINGISGREPGPDLVTDVILGGDGANSLQRQVNLTCKQRLVTLAWNHLGAAPAATAVDVFGALTTLHGNLTATARTPVDVVVFGSMLNSTLPVNLLAPGALANPTTTLNALAADQMLPDCTGWRVYAIGAGTGTQPPLSDTQQADLREFWRQYFHRCGGDLVEWSPHLAAFPVTTGPIPPADTTQIPITRTATTTTATLPGDVLFSPGSAQLHPAAQSQLDQLLPLIPPTSSSVVITGYTDSSCPTCNAHLLSLRRASAVAYWLTAHGIASPRIHVRGLGAADPVATNTTTAGRQRNRRVTVAITT